MPPLRLGVIALPGLLYAMSAAGAWLAFPLRGLVIATGALAAFPVVATTSRRSRWLSARPRMALVWRAARRCLATRAVLT